MGNAVLTQLVRDLMGLGVGMEVKDGAASFTLPKDEPRRSRAEKAVRGSLPAIQDRRDEFLAAWQAEAGGPGRAETVRCPECTGLVTGVEPARQDRLHDPRAEYLGWAFCESLYCPYRTDERAGRYQQRHHPPGVRRDWREKLEKQRRVRRMAGNPGPADPPPIPQ